jgi:26 proteasome complex subunit DSS1
VLTIAWLLADWDDSETSLAQLTNNKGGATGLSISGERGGVSGGDHLWEDNWDDDDVEDDFSKALRWELLRSATIT